MLLTRIHMDLDSYQGPRRQAYDIYDGKLDLRQK